MWRLTGLELTKLNKFDRQIVGQIAHQQATVMWIHPSFDKFNAVSNVMSLIVMLHG